MRNQLQLSELTESLDRGKSYIQVPIELYDLQDLCDKMDNPQLLEYVPVKIVACFEQFFRDEYKEILVNPIIRKRLKDIDLFKNAKFNFEIIGAFEENTITLSDYLSYLIPCSKLNDICNALSQLLEVDLRSEMIKKKEGKKILVSIEEVFKLRHIYCHEVPLKNDLNINNIRTLISHAIDFLDYSDDIIRNELYSDNTTMFEEIKIAKNNYEKTDNELVELIETIKLKQDSDSLFYNNFSYIEKWKEYREERAKCDTSVNNKESYLPLWYYRKMEKITSALIKELKEDYKYELKR